MSSERLDRVMRALAVWDESDRASVDRHGLSMIDLIAGARGHRLLGVLAAAAAAGHVEAGDDDMESLARGLTEIMSEALLLEDVLLDAVEVLDAVGVDHRVLKGSALAHTVHADASQRSFGDTDLLVRSSDIDTAVAALNDAGARRLRPALSSDFDRRFAKSVTLAWRHRTELDLHRTLAPGPFGLRLDPEDLWVEPHQFDLAGVALKTFPPELHLLHGAYHLVLGDVDARYGSVRDLVLLLRSPIAVDEVIETATRWRGRPVLARAVAIVSDLGGQVGSLGPWADTVHVSVRDRAWLQAHGRRRSRFRRQALAVLGELSWRDKPAYLGAVLRLRPRS